MTKREKIIVSIMAATMLLGGYLYWGPVTTDGRQGVEKMSDGQALAFAQKVIQKLKADTSLTKDLFTIRSAERKWEKDPFLPTETLLSDTQQRKVSDNAAVSAGTQPNQVYSGFLEAGTQRLAIINGMAYAAGEAIDSDGHFLRRIQPHQVEIGRRNAPDVIILKMTDYETVTGN